MEEKRTEIEAQLSGIERKEAAEVVDLGGLCKSGELCKFMRCDLCAPSLCGITILAVVY
jgi:hypothetical protein